MRVCISPGSETLYVTVNQPNGNLTNAFHRDLAHAPIVKVVLADTEGELPKLLPAQLLRHRLDHGIRNLVADEGEGREVGGGVGCLANDLEERFEVVAGHRRALRRLGGDLCVRGGSGRGEKGRTRESVKIIVST